MVSVSITVLSLVIQLNINWNRKPPHWPWPWTQQSNIYTGLCWSTIKLTFAAKESLVKKIVMLLDIIHTLTVTLTLRIGQHPNISARHSSPWWCTTTKFGNKKLISSEDIFYCSRQTETHGQTHTHTHIYMWIWCFLPTYMLKQFGLWARLCFVIATIHAGVHDLVHCRTYFDFQPPAQHWWCSNHNQHYHHICTWYCMYIHIKNYNYNKCKVP